MSDRLSQRFPVLPKDGTFMAGSTATPREWVSLTCASDRFDIGRGRVRCHYSTADFTATTNGDVVVVVPAKSCHASMMIAHAVVSSCRSSGHHQVEIVIRRAFARCAQPYRFAYVDGRCYGVIGVSGAFVFDHCGGPCDCDSSSTNYDGGTGADNVKDFLHEERATIALDRHAVFGMTSFVSSLMNTRFSSPRCPACNVPTNYQQVLKYLTTNKDRLSHITSDIHRERAKKIEHLNSCNSLLEHYQIKTKILYAEIEDGIRFTNDLTSSLLKNHKAILWTGDNTIFLKIDKTCETKITANQRFMHSIIISQNQMIDNLTATYKEISVMINTMQLFAEVL